MKVLFGRLLAAGAVVCASATLAQGPPARLEYRSAFEGYRRFQEPEARAWRDANEEVRALGGHMGQAKAVAQPAPVSSTQSPQADKPSPPPAASGIPPLTPMSGHQGHGK